MTAPENRPDSGRLPVVPFLEILSRHRGIVLTLAIGAFIAAAAAGFIVPTTYETAVTILPPDQSLPMGPMGGGIQSTLAMLQVGFATIATSDLYADMIKSRSVMTRVIDRCDLIEAFHLEKEDSLRAITYALQRLDKDVTVSTANNGMISVAVRAHTGLLPGRAAKRSTAQRVAAMGNAISDALDAVNREKNTSRARQTRIYLEHQLAATSERLENATAGLAAFQSGNLALDIGEQMKAAIETAATLQGELFAKEIALGVALQSMQPNNPGVLALRTEVSELRRKLQDMQRGEMSGSSDTPIDALGIVLDQLPELGRTYAQHLREVKVQETLYELLTEQLYRARIQETQDVPVIQVLDEATVPAFKKSPVIRKVAVLGGFLGLLLGILIAYGREWWARYPGRDEDARALKRLLRTKRG